MAGQQQAPVNVQQQLLTREISPKHNAARLHSMDPQTTAGGKNKIVLNSARGPVIGTYSERDNSQDPLKGMQLSQAYQQTRLNPQLTQRKSRGGRDPNKNNQSVEPPNIHVQSNSINAMSTPQAGWGKKLVHVAATSVVSPGLIQNGYNVPDPKLSLREQLYSVKNTMNKQI